MIIQDDVYLDPNRKLSESHKLAIQMIQKEFKEGTPISVLEVGVGSGAVARGLRDIYSQITIDGVDKAPIYLDTSKNYYDNVYYLPIEEFKVDKKYDLIILLDVLEHLENPWEILNSLRTNFLSPSGYVVISIPNVAHWTVRLKLLRGYFKYSKTGILDKTHLRFFTLGTYFDLIKAGGLEIVSLGYTSFLKGFPEYQQFPFSLVPGQYKKNLVDKLIQWKPSIFAVQFISISKPD